MKKLILSLLVVLTTSFAVKASDVEKCKATPAPGSEWEVIVTGFIDYYSKQPSNYHARLYAVNVETNEFFVPDETQDGYVFYLEEGTYRFGGEQDYFCGVCSMVVTVDDNKQFVMETWCE